MLCLLDEINELKEPLSSENREPIVRLKDCINNQRPIDEFLRLQPFVLRVSDGFFKLRWPAMGVQASYFS